MSTKVLVALGVIWAICLSVAPFPGWSAPETRAGIPPNDTLNASSFPAEGKYLNEYTGKYLSLKRALELALQHNPRLKTLSNAVEESAHLLNQAGRLPNPELELELENFGGSGEFSGGASAEASVRVQQRVELGGKRQRRMDVARSGIKIEEIRLRAYATDLRALARTRMTDLAVAQQQLNFARAQVDLSRTLLAMVRSRIEAGKAADIEQIAFNMQLSEAKLNSQEAQTEVQRAKYALASLWGQSLSTFAGVKLNLETLPEQVDIEELYAALDHTPATSISRLRAEVAQQEVLLEQARRIPDLHLNAGVKEERNTGDHALIAGISMGIPIFDRNQDQIAAARTRHRGAEATLHASILEQRLQLQEVWHALANTRREAHMLRTGILPAAQEHFEAVTYAYRAGKYTYQRVLDAQLDLYELRRRYIDVLGNVHRRHIELERICGGPGLRNARTPSESIPELASVVGAGDKQ